MPTSSEPIVLPWRTARAPPCVASSSMSSGCGRMPGIGVVARDAFGQQRDPHHLEHVVGVVVGAVGDRAARRAQGGNRRDDAAVRRHRRLVRDDGAGAAQQRDVGVVDVAAVRREQPRTEEAAPCRETPADERRDAAP